MSASRIPSIRSDLPGIAVKSIVREVRSTTPTPAATPLSRLPRLSIDHVKHMPSTPSRPLTGLPQSNVTDTKVHDRFANMSDCADNYTYLPRLFSKPLPDPPQNSPVQAAQTTRIPSQVEAFPQFVHFEASSSIDRLYDRVKNDADILPTRPQHVQATPVANNRARLSLIKAQNSTGHADRPHSPAPESFSQPRPRKDGECNVFGQPSYFADHGATASSVALYEPKRTPDIVHIRRSSTTRVAQINAKAAEPPTFGARRLDNPSDFAALIRESPTRKSSDLVYPNPTQTPYQDSTPSRSSVSADKSQSDVSPQLSESSNYASHDEAILGAQRHQVASEPAREPDVNKTNAHHRAAFDLLTASHIDQSNPHDILWPSNNPSAQPHPGSKVVIESSTTHQPSLRHIVYQQANRGPYDQAQQHLTDSYEVVVQDDIVSHQTRDNSTAPSMASPFTPSYAQATAASQRRRSDGPNSMWSASTAKSLPPTVEYPPRHSSKLAHGRAMVNRATASSRKAFSDEKLSDFRDDFAEDSLSRRYTPKFANSGLYNRYKTPVKTMSFESSEQVGSHGGKLVASNSKNRLLNNIIGLFSSKREANNAINNGNGVKPRRFKSPRKRKNGPSTDSLNGSGLRTKDDHFSVAGERDSSSLAVQKIAHFATQAWQQAGNTADDARKERMFAIASVLLDALTNSKEAEKAMLEAHKAAVAAQASYAMMQHGLVEIARLLDNHANAISTLDSTDMKGGQV